MFSSRKYCLDFLIFTTKDSKLHFSPTFTSNLFQKQTRKGGILTDLIKVVDFKALYYWSCVESVAKFLFLFGWFSDIFELFEAPQYQSINSNVGRQNLHFILLNNRSIWRFTHCSEKPTRCFYMRLKTSISNYFSLLRYHISV